MKANGVPVCPVDAFRRLEAYELPKRRGPLISKIINSGLVDLMNVWPGGVLGNSEKVPEAAQRIIRLLLRGQYF